MASEYVQTRLRSSTTKGHFAPFGLTTTCSLTAYLSCSYQRRPQTLIVTNLTFAHQSSQETPSIQSTSTLILFWALLQQQSHRARQCLTIIQRAALRPKTQKKFSKQATGLSSICVSSMGSFGFEDAIVEARILPQLGCVGRLLS